MMPGMRGMNPQQMKQMMKRMGITTEEMDAELVIIKTKDREIHIEEPSVTMMNVKGEKTFQIGGKVKDMELGAFDKIPTGPVIPDEDVLIVAQQANVDEATARKALEETSGDLAEAIVKLMGA
ncbi:MAG TPA: nascent polypeptide-associated complex protein [Euryarchaeota archaeon]|nr:nascent polypeptide-associated complex protein [Euryarchaeota archaeon]